MSTALYRKYRPDNFENIVGQNQVIDVLKNQIKENKISHAYVFSGTRGTGKTSTAKVFAKSLNCQDYDEITGPCNKCSSCLNDYIDTIEIDAASNNSVDNIRALKDTIMYQPSYGKYKVYIIDEAHMLSMGAFNALLKTLEEPPSHVIFILATTELNKIPATILSRCQKFEFKKVGLAEIKSRLTYIVNEEKIPNDEEAIDYIATMCDGGLRDAISTLDQVASFGYISMQNLDFVTGMSSINKIDEYLRAIFTKNTFDALKVVNDMITDNIDVKKLPAQVISRLIEMIYLQNEVEKDIIQVENLRELLEKSKDTDVSNLIVDISEVENNMKYASFPDILFQSFTVKRCQNIGIDIETQSLIKEIQVLKQRIENLEKNGVVATSSDKKEETNEETSKQKERAKPKDKTEEIAKLQEEISSEEQEKIDNVNSLILDIHNVLRSKNSMPISAFLHEGNIRRYLGDNIYLSFNRNHSFHKTKIEQDQNKNILISAFEQILGKKVEISIVFDDEIIKENTEEVNAKITQDMQELFGDVKFELLNE